MLSLNMGLAGLSEITRMSEIRRLYPITIFNDGKALIDLRTAQVYWDAIFLVSQEVYLNFHHFCG